MTRWLALLILAVPAAAQTESPCDDPCNQGHCSEFGSGFWTDWCSYEHALVEPLDCPAGWTTNVPCLQEAGLAYLVCVANTLDAACAEQTDIADRWCSDQHKICGRFESCWDSCMLSPQPQLCQQACLAAKSAALAGNCAQVGGERMALEIAAGYALEQCDDQFQANSLLCCDPPEGLPFGAQFLVAV